MLKGPSSGAGGALLRGPDGAADFPFVQARGPGGAGDAVEGGHIARLDRTIRGPLQARVPAAPLPGCTGEVQCPGWRATAMLVSNGTVRASKAPRALNVNSMPNSTFSTP